MADVFISYSSKDEDIALSLCSALEKKGIPCWIAPRNITGGMTYASEIAKGIRDAKIVLVIVSENSGKSPHVLNEINMAVDNEKIILPFKIDSATLTDEFRYYLNKTHWINAFPEPKEAFPEVVENTSILLELKISSDVEVDILYDSQDQKKKNLQNLKEKTKEQRFSFGESISNKREEIDEHHFYENISRFDVVDSIAGTWSSYRFLTIRNVSDESTGFITHKECGENKADFQKLRVRARLNDYNGDQLVVEPVTDIQPNFDQVFRIYFPKPLVPGESMQIFYRLDWPNEPDAYYQSELSQSISLTRYAKKVGRLEFAIFSPVPICSSYMEEINEKYEESVSTVLPQNLAVADEARLAPLHGKNLFGIKYVVEDVNAVSYRIFYKLDDTDSQEEEEDFF